MELVEGSLAEQLHQAHAGQLGGPPVQVVVDQSTAGEVEAVVETAQLLPQRRRQEQRAALAHGPEDPPPRRAGEGGHPEQLVGVVLPAGGGQESIFGRLVVAHLGGPHVGHRSEVPRRRRHHRSLRQPGRQAAVATNPRRAQASAVDHQPDEVTGRRPDAGVGGARRRRRRGVEADRPEVAAEPGDDVGIHRSPANRCRPAPPRSRRPRRRSGAAGRACGACGGAPEPCRRPPGPRSPGGPSVPHPARSRTPRGYPAAMMGIERRRRSAGPP